MRSSVLSVSVRLWRMPVTRLAMVLVTLSSCDEGGAAGGQAASLGALLTARGF